MDCEHKLREAACIGDIESVQILLQKGVDVNARHEINGWAPLHWAAKRGHKDIVRLLLAMGADVTQKTKNKETPVSLCMNPEIRQLLLLEMGSTKIDPPVESSLPIIPNYLKHPPLAEGVEIHEPKRFTLSQERHTAPALGAVSVNQPEEVVLKVRVANTGDPDFIEVELPCDDMTFSRLLRLCAEELDINPANVTRIRKLPNVIVRKDKDVSRLRDGQELELVLQLDATNRLIPCSNGMLKKIPSSNANIYQSISLNKNQTILY